MNKSYGVIISVHDVTNKIFSCDSNYSVNVAMWPKFGNSNIYNDLNRKTTFLRGGIGSSLILASSSLGLPLDTNLIKCGKMVKTKSQKVLGDNLYVCRG